MTRNNAAINVGVNGAEQAKRDLNKVAAAEKRVGDAGADAGRRASGGMTQQASATHRAADGVAKLARNLGLLAAGQKIIATLREDTEGLADAAERSARAMRGTLALTEVAGERPEVRNQIWRFAVNTGRPIEEAAPAYYTFLGGTAGMDDERRQGLLGQAALFSKTDLSADLDGIISLFSTMGSQNPNLSAQQIGNMVSQTIELAKSTPSEMAQYLPSVLSTANAANVDPATAMAAFAFATRKGGGVAQSGNAVRSTLLGLLTPSQAVAEEMAGYGYTPGGPLAENLMWLARSGDTLPDTIQAQLGGRRGLEAVSALASAPREFVGDLRLLRGAVAAPDSLIRNRLASLYGEDEAQRLLDQASQIAVLAQQAKTEEGLDEQRIRAHLDLRELAELRAGTNPASRKLIELTNDIFSWVGMDASQYQGKEESAMYRLLDRGYAPDAIMQHIFPMLKEDRVPDGLDDYEAYYDQILRKAGVAPMQGVSSVIVNNGGTIHVNADGRSDAGRPVAGRGNE